jgi:signal transduction histidine kinase
VSVLRPDLLLEVTYEPVGVAAFALGSLFVVETDSRRLRRPARTQLVDHLQDPVVVVDADGTVRDRNAAAGTLFEATDHALAVGAPLPDRFESVITSTELVVVAVDGEDRDFLVNRSAVEFGPHHRGWGYVLTDVTRLVTQQRELERQRRAMDDIAAATAHELRNGLNIASGYADLLCETADAGDARNDRGRPADALRDAHARMRRVVDDLTSLARLAQPTRAVEPRRMCDAVAAARRRLTASSLAVDVACDGCVVAEETRLVELLHKLFEHAAQRDASRVTVSVTARGFTVRHDGRPLADAASAFEHGTAAAEGIGLANAGALARVHGWTLSLSTNDAGGTTVVATGVDTVPDGDPSLGPRTA